MEANNPMEAKWKHIRMVPVLLFLLAALCLLAVVAGNIQSMTAMPISQSFTGEYSRDGEIWHPLDDHADLDALKGDLFLRGHFSCDISSGGRLYYYQDHIGVTVYLRGELVFTDTVTEFADHGLSLEPSVCGSQWSYFITPDITAGDEVTIRLHNPHTHMNGNAYREFLGTLYNSPDTSYILESFLKPYSFPLQLGGMMLIIAALMLLGGALASRLLRVSLRVSLWKLGFLTLFMGGFVVLDTIGISFISELVVFNTYGRQLCMMLAVYCMGLCVCDTLTGKPRKIADVAMLLSGLLDSVLILVSFAGDAVIYDTGFCWIISQGVICLLLMACAAAQTKRAGKKERFILLSDVLLLAAILLDTAGVGRSIYSHGTCTKAVFMLMFLVYGAAALRHVMMDYQASLRAKELEKALEDSRIATMLSQIQPHFIYNTLGTVEQLCREQPEAAADLVHNFSMYLRGNFSELDNPAPILLSKELEHVRYYVAIEHVRFPDMEVLFHLDAEDFLLPALSVQPLVENAIKHGLMGLEKGGTVTVSTYETEKDYCVSVEDDGVGFDPSILQDSRQHIGIRNIRKRLEAMCGGTLTVESAPGKGTKAVITVPKERGYEP
ncbi:MAG: sensor histidine kinase [Anaerovoracaceae bacterium]